MKCDHIQIGDTTAIICTRGRRHNCQFCSRYATKQCDFPIVRNGKDATCSAWCCDRCATSQSVGIDYCPPHERNKLKIMESRLRSRMGGPELLEQSYQERRSIRRLD